MGARRGRPEHRQFHAVPHGAKYAICGWQVPASGYAMTQPSNAVSCFKCQDLLRAATEAEAAGLARAREDNKGDPVGVLTQAFTDLYRASDRVWKASMKYGPVDDGRPEGDEFDEALVHMRATAQVVRRLAGIRNEPAPGGGPGAGSATQGAG